MKIPPDAKIPQPKLTQYLLIFKPRNDKSKYLQQGGFFVDNWQALEKAIKDLIQTTEAVRDASDEYGTYYSVTGNLIGLNQQQLPVITIWIERHIDQRFYFVTLKPYRP